MPVGYGYVRSDEPTIVDWGAITKQATDSLLAIDEDRKKRKADIEETNREFYKTLADRPVSQNTAFNSFMSDYSSQVSAAMLSLTNQLKSGNMSEEEFYRKRANIQSQTEIMLNNFNTYSQKYDEYIKRAGPNGVGASIEAFERSLGKEFMNFENLRPIIDPNSYEVAFTREVEGAFGKTQLQAASANDVFQFSNFTRDKFDLDAAIKNTLSKVGIKTFENEYGQLISGQYVGKGGEVLTEAIKKDAKAIASQDETVISILTDYGVEKTYDFNLLPNDVNNIANSEERNKKIKQLQEANPDIIYRDSNGKYYVSEAQKEAAVTFVQEQITNATSYKVKEEEFGIREKKRLELEKLQDDIDNIVARTLNTEASTNLINARIDELQGETESDLSLNMPAIESFIRKEIGGPIQAAIKRNDKGGFLGIETWFTDKDNQISKRLANVLGNFGVKINSQKLLKQQLELTVPKPGGTTGKVEIDIRGLKPEEIIDKITEAVIYVPDENLEFIYNRFIKGTDDDTKTSNTGLGG
jgi:hypothetical protein|tara:strand:- start:2938 stop:4518 length:1581 start_codon:yes stop_codon:yes gene_type:complete